MSYDALLLDYDGVVVNVLSEEQRLPPFRDRFGRALDIESSSFESGIVDQLAHGVTPTDLEAVSDQIGLNPERLWRYRDQALAAVFEEAARNGRKVPYDDVSAVRDLAKPIGIVSNNQRQVVDALNDGFGLADQFETVQARQSHPDSLSRKKPNPAYVEAAIDDLGVVDPLFVGDKETDILAGARAGVDTALIRRDHNVDRPVDSDPTYEIESLEAAVELL